MFTRGDAARSSGYDNERFNNRGGYSIDDWNSLVEGQCFSKSVKFCGEFFTPDDEEADEDAGSFDDISKIGIVYNNVKECDGDVVKFLFCEVDGSKRRKSAEFLMCVSSIHCTWHSVNTLVLGVLKTRHAATFLGLIHQFTSDKAYRNAKQILWRRGLSIVDELHVFHEQRISASKCWLDRLMEQPKHYCKSCGELLQHPLEDCRHCIEKIENEMDGIREFSGKAQFIVPFTKLKEITQYLAGRNLSFNVVEAASVDRLCPKMCLIQLNCIKHIKIKFCTIAELKMRYGSLVQCDDCKNHPKFILVYIKNKLKIVSMVEVMVEYVPMFNPTKYLTNTTTIATTPTQEHVATAESTKYASLPRHTRIPTTPSSSSSNSTAIYLKMDFNPSHSHTTTISSPSSSFSKQTSMAATAAPSLSASSLSPKKEEEEEEEEEEAEEPHYQIPRNTSIFQLSEANSSLSINYKKREEEEERRSTAPSIRRSQTERLRNGDKRPVRHRCQGWWEGRFNHKDIGYWRKYKFRADAFIFKTVLIGNGTKEKKLFELFNKKSFAKIPTCLFCC